ncbi:MAG: portal protein [Candidatus Nanopelagicaceae bacterium]|nr:portal protein [Candidatus Nanopelagicaceae bacterium]
MSWQLFDRLRTFFRSENIYRYENLQQDQPDVRKTLEGGRWSLGAATAGALLEQTNLSINRMERYKDYDQMDEMGEISASLDMYSDEGTLVDAESKHSLMIKTKYARVKRELQELFFIILTTDLSLRSWFRYLCKYGDLPLEIIPTANRDGIASVRALNVYNFSRVETKKGDLIGFFYQDENESKPTFFHPWQIVHFRLSSLENLFLPNGRSLLEGSRKDFKRLRLMEDAALIYRICLRGDSKVWTPMGYKAIKDVKVGDEVFSYTEKGNLKKTKVTHWLHNGREKVFRIHSLHREIFATSKHPILVIDPYKKDGIYYYDRMRYVDVENLKFGIKAYAHRFLLPKLHNAEHVTLQQVEVPEYAKLREPLSIKSGKAYLGQKVGLKRSSVERFLRGEHWLPVAKANELLLLTKLKHFDLVVKKGWTVSCMTHEVRDMHLPTTADEDFARWFGFMIGDGFISRRKNGKSTLSEVGMVLGDDQETNERYKTMFEGYVGAAQLSHLGGHRLGAYCVHSAHLVDFMFRNGFIPGAANKRIPSWVFASPPSVQEAFIEGYMDADGCRRSFQGGRTDGMEVECCNKMLVEDLKELCHRLGWCVGLVGHRFRKGGHVIDKETGRKMPDTESWQLHINKTDAPEHERILGVEEVDEDDVYDITVEAEEHNFIANGVPVSNCRAPERRIFKVPIGEIPAQQVESYLDQFARKLKKRRFFNPSTGQLDERWSPLIQEDDYILPRRPDGTGPEVDTLPGAENLDQIADIEYFKKKMVAALKIPFSRVGIGEPGEDGRQSLSQVAPEFAKAVQWIQRVMCAGLQKIALVHLALKNYTAEELKNFNLYMTAGSAIDELYRIEKWSTRADVMATLKDIGLFNPEWIMGTFTDLSEDEIKKMLLKTAGGSGLPEAPAIGDLGGLGGPSEDEIPKLPEGADPQYTKLLTEFVEWKKKEKDEESEERLIRAGALEASPSHSIMEAGELRGLNELRGKTEGEPAVMLESKDVEDDKVRCEAKFLKEKGDFASHLKKMSRIVPLDTKITEITDDDIPH